MMPNLCDAQELTESGRVFRVTSDQGPYYVMVFLRGEQIFAFQNVCPHRHLSLSWAPDKFLIGDDGLLVCPHHGAAFEIETGECLQGPCAGDRLIPVNVHLQGEELWLD